jgi:hypothetical protein
MRLKIVFFGIDRHNRLIQFTLNQPNSAASAIVPQAVFFSGDSQCACQAGPLRTAFPLCGQGYEFKQKFMLRLDAADSIFSLSHSRQT